MATITGAAGGTFSATGGLIIDSLQMELVGFFHTW